MSRPFRKFIKLVVDNYTGEFFFMDDGQRWRKLHLIGNADVAMDVAEILRHVGHVVKVEDHSEEAE